jgi:heptosyltransferase II
MLAALDLLTRFRAIVPRVSRGKQNVKETVQKILVIEPKNIGDVVLTLPFLTQLKAMWPRAHITLLASPFARQLLAGTGLVDEFIDTNLGWSEQATRYNPLGYNWKELARLRRELPARHFDLAFKCCMHVREHIVIGLSGATRRIAYAFGVGDNVLTDAVPVLDPNRHKVADWLELASHAAPLVETPTPRLNVSRSEREWAREYLSSRGIGPTCSLVGIHPGASVPAKVWPLNRFREVVMALSKRNNTRVLVFIDPAGYGAPLGGIDGVATAQVSLRQLMALIERCALLVCNDSGPMHIAGALGVRTVAIFGSGINRWFAPLGSGHQLISRGQMDSPTGSVLDPYDVSQVAVASVRDAIDKALDNLP